MSENTMTSRFEEIANAFDAVERQYVNRTSLTEFRQQWLTGFHEYFHQVKDDKGNILDPDGKVMAYWNTRRLDDGKPACINQDTHIYDEQGKTIYILPCTMASLNTLRAVNGEGGEHPMTQLISYAYTNPNPALGLLELKRVFREKLKGVGVEEEQTMYKMLSIDYILYKEGFGSLYDIDYDAVHAELSEGKAPKETSVEDTPTTTVEAEDDFNFDSFEPIDDDDFA